MGETHVDLHHLLEDLRDAYPGSLEETILTEIVANALDSVREPPADAAAEALRAPEGDDDRFQVFGCEVVWFRRGREVRDPANMSRR